MTTTTDERPFGFVLRKPGPRVDGDFGDETPVYTAPGFDQPQPAWQTHAGSDPRHEPESEWALALPHHCGEWEIWDGPREDVLAAAKRFRAELDAAIATIEGSASTGRFEDFLAEINTADGARLLDLSQQTAVAYLDGNAITKGQFEELNAAWFERMRQLVPPTVEAIDE